MGNKLGRLAWRWVCPIFFRPTPPRLAGGWRRFVLKCFGAKLSHNAWIHPSVKIWAPWLLEVGSDSFIAENVHLYNAYGIRIGDRVNISMGAMLCTASHDYRQAMFPLIGGKITIENDSWVAAEAFVSPGITVAAGAVVAARAVVTKNVEGWTVVGGNPAKFIKRREMKS